jgi:hypothetical protein
MKNILQKIYEYGIGRLHAIRKYILNISMLFSRSLRTLSPSFKKRRSLAKELKQTHWTSFIPRNESVMQFNAGQIPGTDKIVDVCREILIKRENEFNNLREKSKKSYLYNVLLDDDFEKYPALLEIALSDTIVEIISGYVGYVPRLGTINLLVSIPGKIVKGSQWLHIDAGDPDNIKCFINITDIDDSNGPLNVLPKTLSTKFRNASGRAGGFGKFPDSIVDALLNDSDFIKNTGVAGSGIFADTSKCCHFGGRVEKGMRAMLVIHYSRFSFGEGHLPSAHFRTRYATDETRRTLLTIDP